MSNVGQLDRMRWTTSRYPWLRAGLGLSVVGVVVATIGLLGSTGHGSAMANIVLWCLAAAALLPLDRYYRRRFGRVTPTSAARLKGLGAALAWLLLVLVILVLPAVTGWSTGPFLLAGGALVTAWALVDRRRSGGLQPSIVVAGIFLLGLGLLVLAGAPVSSWFDDQGVLWFNLAAGAALIIAGLLDHFTLIRGLRPPPRRP